MSDAPWTAGQRTAEENHLRKLQYNRERYHKLMMQPTVESNNDEPSIPSLQATPLYTAPKKKTLPQVPSPKEPIIECPYSPTNQLFDDWDDANVYNNDNNEGGHTAEGSEGGHIEEDIYRAYKDEYDKGRRTVEGNGEGRIEEDIYSASDE